MKRVHVEVWSDFVCPWCWIAKRRFEKAVHQSVGKVEVVVTHKAYRLAKGAAPSDLKQVLVRKFGNQASAEQMMAAIAHNAAMEGLTYNFDTMRFGDTTDAHALLKSIAMPEERQLMIERLHLAATTEGRDIFDRKVLVSLAEEIGLDGGAIDFDFPPTATEIVRDELEASRVANGVPLFVFNDQFHISGAREVAVFKQALLEAAIEMPKSDAAESSCSMDRCGI